MLLKIWRPATLVSSRYEEMSRGLAPPKISMEPCMDNMLLLLTKLALLFVSVLFVQQMSNIKWFYLWCYYSYYSYYNLAYLMLSTLAGGKVSSSRLTWRRPCEAQDQGCSASVCLHSHNLRPLLCCRYSIYSFLIHCKNSFNSTDWNYQDNVDKGRLQKSMKISIKGRGGQTRSNFFFSKKGVV